MTRRRKVITYLVSGDEDIHPSHENIQRTGRRVRHGRQVDGDARRVLRPGHRFVVVAHGNRAGNTVSWFRDDWDDAQPWLYVGMKQPPRGARIHLYSCFAGKKLPRFLKKSEVFGHKHAVPTPTGPAKAIVLAFFDQVEPLFDLADFDREHWRTTLGEYVNELLVQETANLHQSARSMAVLQILRKSLGYLHDSSLHQRHTNKLRR